MMTYLPLREGIRKHKEETPTKVRIPERESAATSNRIYTNRGVNYETLLTYLLHTAQSFLRI
jgi:predicted DNA binding CopG/RHH family protein